MDGAESADKLRASSGQQPASVCATNGTSLVGYYTSDFSGCVKSVSEAIHAVELVGSGYDCPACRQEATQPEDVQSA